MRRLSPPPRSTGRGIEELKQALGEACAAVAESSASEWFRLAIDRYFVVQGYGTVVTGSVASGRLKVGNEIEWLPAANRCECAACRTTTKRSRKFTEDSEPPSTSREFHTRKCAGDKELAAPGYLIPSKVLTVRLHALADLSRPIKHRTEVRLHIGAAETIAAVSLLDCDAIETGGWGLVQLFLDEMVTATWGQPFVLRESSAQHTLGGGKYCNRLPLRFAGGTSRCWSALRNLARTISKTRAGIVAWFGGCGGFTTADLIRRRRRSRSRGADRG